MAILKFAHAPVVHPGVGLSPEEACNRWQKVRTASRRNGNVTVDLVEQASSIFEVQFNPADYLLTHATIVASVDVYEPAGVKLGSVLEGGFRVNRKYGDYRIKRGCDKYINNNFDAWSRPVLLKSYRTFVGAHNFVEHVQIEDLSKGRIIDAAARDIGDSIYVDILIATAREHTDLVRAIESGKMATLSMGCTVDGTVCTKCGHWAADETEMCPHVKYEKGNTFFDSQGGQHRIAELCGHETLEPTGGVHFIEGSWVGTPAFTGAVARNILEPVAGLSRRAQEILSLPPKKWDAGARKKAAGFGATDTVLGQWGDEEEEEEGAAAEPTSPFKELEDDLTTHMLDRVKKRLRDEMSQEDAEEALTPENPASDHPNDTLVKEGVAKVYQASLDTLVRTASSDALLLDRIASLNQRLGIDIPVPVYRAVLAAGAYDPQQPKVFLRACHRALGRQPNLAEAKTMVRLGKLISRRGAAATPSSPLRGENHPGNKSRRL